MSKPTTTALAYLIYTAFRELARNDRDLAFRVSVQRLLLKAIEAGHGDVIASASAAVRSRLNFLLEREGTELPQRSLYEAVAIEPSAFRQFKRHFGLRSVGRGRRRVMLDLSIAGAE